MKLDLSNYKKAILFLGEALEVSKDLKIGRIISPEERLMRAGVIQNFEFSFEISWKFIKRALEIYYNADAEQPRTELFRLAYENSLIENVESWKTYNKAGNLTSHTYDEGNADIVFNCAKDFYKDADKLLTALEKLNAR
jgi:nucleotidyltransferase substrate binding protein (TIGR01987 family)